MVQLTIRLPWWPSGKESSCNAGDAGSILCQEGPQEKKMATYSSVFIREIHGQRSLMGYSPQSHKRVRHNLVTQQQHTNSTFKKLLEKQKRGDVCERWSQKLQA